MPTSPVLSAVGFLGAASVPVAVLVTFFHVIAQGI